MALFNITEQNRKWWIFAGMSLALAIVFLDQTAIAVALPPIQKDLAMSNTMLQWVINSYLAVLAALVMFGGKLGDVVGHKRIFLIGIVIFVFSSISCAAAHTGLWIVISRAVQGIGGAFMIPVTGVMVAHAFSHKERGKAMGLYIACASIFLTLGPLLSGLLVHYLSWRWVFWINVPISIISIFLTVISVPKSEDKRENKVLDWKGFIAQSIFISSLVVALIESTNFGWDSPFIISLLIIAAVFAVLFFIIEKRAVDPIVYLPLFKRRDFLGASLSLLFLQCAFAASFFWAILLQNVMGYSAMTTGLFYLPVTVPVMFMSPLAGMMRDKYGPRLPATIGSIIVIIATFWIAISVFAGNYLAMLPGFLLFGIGPALIYSSVMATSMSSVPLSQRGMATGISSGFRQLGSALGVAVISSVVNTVEHHRLISNFSNNTEVQSITVRQLMSLLSNPSSAKTILVGFSPDQINNITHILKTSFTFAFSMGMVCSGIFVILTLFSSRLLPDQPLEYTT